MIVLLFHSISLRENKSSRGSGVGRDRYLLENVLPWDHTEEFPLRGLDSESEGLNENSVLNLVSNYEGDIALPVVLLQKQKGSDSKYSWLLNRVSKTSTKKRANFPVNLTLKTELTLQCVWVPDSSRRQVAVLCQISCNLTKEQFSWETKAFYFKEDNF